MTWSRCAVLVVAAAWSLPAAAQRCRPPDATRDGMLYYLAGLVTATDSVDIAERDSIYNVPVVPVRQIGVVTDERVCAKGSKAYGQPEGSAVPPRVYVIRMRPNRDVVLDPDQRAGDFKIVKIFDERWRLVGEWTGG